MRKSGSEIIIVMMGLALTACNQVGSTPGTNSVNQGAGPSSPVQASGANTQTGKNAAPTTDFRSAESNTPIQSVTLERRIPINKADGDGQTPPVFLESDPIL